LIPSALKEGLEERMVAEIQKEFDRAKPTEGERKSMLRDRRRA
jgi:hypothetical protein